MPKKYSIHPHPAPPRFRPPGKLGIVDWREDCAGCHNCVKRNCVYELYRDEVSVLHEEFGFLDYIYQCKGCLVCVQNCTKNILTRVVNPEYKVLGDTYYTPEIILSTWYQAETGKIPVSGSGYGGKFSGTGFDSMWTDMSEIVRPTRDGIHGREYINTGVEIGRKLPYLTFHKNGLSIKPPPRIEIPVPLLFDVIPEYWHRGPVLQSIITAAREMGLYTVVRCRNILEHMHVGKDNIIPFIENINITNLNKMKGAKMIMLQDESSIMKEIASIKEENKNQIIAVRIDAAPDVSKRIAALTSEGVEVVHLVFDMHGFEQSSLESRIDEQLPAAGVSNLLPAEGALKPRHIRDVLRDVHSTLVKQGTRDQVTIIASGGIAMAEHMAKAIICGADLVALDLPLLIALECRLCMECERGEKCQIDLDMISIKPAALRITNLICAWRNQLLELLGAMGIREVRRLRGETGRSMFFEDLERETFGSLFGKRKEIDEKCL